MIPNNMTACRTTETFDLAWAISSLIWTISNFDLISDFDRVISHNYWHISHLKHVNANFACVISATATRYFAHERRKRGPGRRKCGHERRERDAGKIPHTSLRMPFDMNAGGFNRVSGKSRFFERFAQIPSNLAIKNTKWLRCD